MKNSSESWDVLGDSRKRYRSPWAEIGKYWPGKEPIRLQDSLPCPLKKKKKRIFTMITSDKIWRTCARNVMKMINSYVSLIWQHLHILYCLMRQKSWWCSRCFVSKFRLSVVKLSNGFVSRTNSIEIMASCVWSRLLNPDFVVDKLKKKTKGSCIRSNKWQ